MFLHFDVTKPLYNYAVQPEELRALKEEAFLAKKEAMEKGSFLVKVES